MLKIITLLIILTALGVGSWFLFSQQRTAPNEIIQESQVAASPTSVLPFTSHFLIFTNGTKRIFTDSRYHNISEVAYINKEKPNSIVVNKAGVTWGMFFATLPMKLTKDCLTTGTGQNFCSNNTGQLMFYVNGEKAPEALDMVINPGDRLLVSYGQSEAVTNQLLQLEEVE